MNESGRRCGSASLRSASAARADIADYIHWYNTGRPHSSLSDVTPEQAYLNGLTKLVEAA